MANGWNFDDSSGFFFHCGRQAYWEGNEVFCSKCQSMLED
jgi:hypothetical protein